VFHIDQRADLPPYEQLQQQITDQVRDGSLAAGVALPTVRALAVELGVAPNTVAKVYKALDQEGYLITGGRRGTVVADQDASGSTAAYRLTVAFVSELGALGVGPGETMRLVRQVLAD